MSYFKKTAGAVLLLALLCQISFVAASAQYGASAVEDGRTYTLEQMLTLAIEDEYLALRRYTVDMEVFGRQKPFVQIAASEKRHIAELEPLLIKYGVTVPTDRSAAHVRTPGDLMEAFKTAIAGEKANIRMYETFLKRELPDDIRSAFMLLKSAAQSHLRAFELNAARLERRAASEII